MRHTHPSRARGDVGRAHDGRTKTCPGCSEPATTFQKIGNVEICTSCVARIRERARGIQADRRGARPNGEIASLMSKNGAKERRHGSEEIGYGADSPLDAEPMD